MTIQPEYHLQRPQFGNWRPDEHVWFTILSYLYFDIMTDFDIFWCILINETYFNDKLIISM